MASRKCRWQKRSEGYSDLLRLVRHADPRQDDLLYQAHHFEDNGVRVQKQLRNTLKQVYQLLGKTIIVKCDYVICGTMRFEIFTVTTPYSPLDVY
jgi:hypothetical protein